MSDFFNKYPYTDFHEMNLDWIIERVKKLTEDWASTLEEWNNTEEQWQELYDYVHNYFDNLDVQQEINNKINAMIADGTFVTITTPVIEAKVASMMPATVASQIGDTVASQIGATVAGQIGDTVASQIDTAIVSPVNNWLTAHITQPTTPVVDNTLTITGAAADAKVTGDRIHDCVQAMNDAGNVTGLYVGTLEHKGYRNTSGTYDAPNDYHTKVTELLPCSPGDVYEYHGRSSAAAPAAIFYDSSKQIVSTIGALDGEDITVPAGVAYVSFASYQPVGTDITLYLLTSAWNSAVETLQSDINTEIQNKSAALGDSIGAYIYLEEHAGYRTSSGTYDALSSYHSKTTDLIPCASGDNFVFDGNSSAAAPSAIFYDSSKQIVSTANGDNITIPDNISYVSFSSYAAISDPVYITVHSDIFEVLLNGNVRRYVQLYDGYIDKSNGTESSDSFGGTYKKSGKIKVYKDLGIYLNAEAHGSAGYMFYTESGTAIQGGSNKGFLTIPTGADYLKFTDYDAGADHTGVYYEYYSGLYGNIVDINDGYDHLTDYVSPIIQCVGDSVTAGIGTTGQYRANYGQDPYPAQIKTMLVDNGIENITVLNTGHPGERCVEVGVRTGSLSCYFAEDVTIPGDGSYVSLGQAYKVNDELMGTKIKAYYHDANDSDYCIVFRAGDNSDHYPVYINEEEYIIKVIDNPLENQIKKSVADGVNTTIKAGTLLYTKDNRNGTYVHNIMFAGLNDWRYLTMTEWTDLMNISSEATGNKSIVIGSYKNIWDSWPELTGATAADRYAEYIYLANKAFGIRFIDMYNEWFEHAMTYACEAGYFSDKTPEQLADMQDLIDQKIIPADFTYNNTQDDVHFNKAGYYVFARIIYDRMKRLNWI